MDKYWIKVSYKNPRAASIDIALLSLFFTLDMYLPTGFVVKSANLHADGIALNCQNWLQFTVLKI